MRRRISTFAIVLVTLALVLGLTGMALADEPSYTEVWDGRGADSQHCEYMGQEGRPATGWIHWVFATKGDSTSAELVLGGTGSGTYAPGEPFVAEIWHFYTPFFELEGLTATINLFGGGPGPGGGLVISDYCPGAFEMLEVTKTAETSFTRIHAWDIEKRVETENGFTEDGLPKIWLWVDGSGDETATWIIDVDYTGFADSDFAVSGTVTISNTGSLDAVITGIEDLLAGEVISLDCGVEFPYTLAVGGVLECSYSEEGYFEGLNEVTVTTERDTYSADAEIIWGDPEIESFASVNVSDISGDFGSQDLGTLDAPDDGGFATFTFTYTWEFRWEDFGRENCGDFLYDNEARIIETEDSAEASLKVNVQCMVFQGETAWAANGNVPLQLRYTPRGNWATYVQYAAKTTTLFAGQHIAVGTVTFSPVEDGMVTITINLTGDWEFADVAENVKVQGYASAPSGNPSPGLFAHKMTATGSPAVIVVPANNFYGVHVNVGQWMPDPNFGP